MPSPLDMCRSRALGEAVAIDQIVCSVRWSRQSVILNACDGERFFGGSLWRL